MAINVTLRVIDADTGAAYVGNLTTSLYVERMNVDGTTWGAQYLNKDGDSASCVTTNGSYALLACRNFGDQLNRGEVAYENAFVSCEITSNTTGLSFTKVQPGHVYNPSRLKFGWGDSYGWKSEAKSATGDVVITVTVKKLYQVSFARNDATTLPAPDAKKGNADYPVSCEEMSNSYGYNKIGIYDDEDVAVLGSGGGSYTPTRDVTLTWKYEPVRLWLQTVRKDGASSTRYYRINGGAWTAWPSNSSLIYVYYGQVVEVYWLASDSNWVSDHPIGNPYRQQISKNTGGYVVNMTCTHIPVVVSFVDWDGSDLGTATVAYLAAVPESEKPIPSRRGYNFIGWSDALTRVSANVTVTAQYERKSYVVKFVDYDGTILKTQNVLFGDAAIPPEDPVREGFEFTGWSGDYSDVQGNLEIVALYYGMVKYRIKGRRYLRMYKADRKTPAYAAVQDAALVVESLCKVPWVPVADVAAIMPTHTEAMIDRNIANREWFDAAEFCAEHEADGSHRAYAQAACYRFALPDEAVGLPLASVKLRVTSDPYNPYGARIAVLTSSTGEIPMDCATVRGGDFHSEPDDDGIGVAPRLYSEDSKGNQTWYSNTEDAVVAPSGELLLKKYLLVFVCLENYGRARNGWLEGSSYIRNDIEIGVMGSIDGFSETELNDCMDSPVQFAVCRGGVLPEATGASGVAVVELQASGDDLPAEGGASAHASVSAEQSCIGLRMLYARFRSGGAVDVPASYALVSKARPGAGFAVQKSTRTTGGVTYPVWRMISAMTSVPFAVPVDFKASRLRLDWDGWSGVATGGKFRVWLKRGSLVGDVATLVKNPRFYDASVDSVDGWELVGSVDAADENTTATFDLSKVLDGYFASILLTAYISFDEVNPDSETVAAQGVVPNMNVDIVAGTASMMQNGWKPDITLIG